MKYFLMMMTVLFAGASANAAAPSLNQARKAQALVHAFLEKNKKTYSYGLIGMSACDPRTGESSTTAKKREYCVVIGAPDVTAYYVLERRFPKMTRVGGVLIDIQLRGPIRPQPRMTGGT